MSLLTEVLMYMGAFLGLIIAGYVLANFLTKGLVWAMTKARLTKRILVKVHTVSKPYYRLGKIVAGANGSSFMTYTPRNNVAPGGQKVQKMIKVSKGSIQQNMGVDYMEVDEETNNILSFIDWKVVPGHDAESTDALYKRIAMLPKSMSQKEVIILILVLLTFLVTLYLAWRMGKIQEQVELLHQVYNATRTIPAEVGNIPA